jgi:hypothetical protein
MTVARHSLCPMTMMASHVAASFDYAFDIYATAVNWSAAIRQPPYSSTRSNGCFGSETSQTALAAGREKYHRTKGQVCANYGFSRCSEACPIQ